jgi:DNA-binding Lrp family transcriptional regulator
VSTPTQRQTQILQWLENEPSIKLAQLAARLNVSVMTVHRDADALAKRGALVKARGAVEQVGLSEWTTRLCPLCRTPVLDRLRFSFTTAAGRRQEACCGHCALLLAKQPSEMESLLATDYLYGRIISAGQAHYVVASRVAVCCEPSVLPFLTNQDAADFRNAFGGQVINLAEVRAQLR